VVLCVDGSDLSTDALRAGLEVLGAGAVPVLVTVAEPGDPMEVTGTGIAGGTITPEQFDAEQAARAEAAQGLLAEVAAALGLEGADQRVAWGQPGPAICDVAAELGAAAIVIGTRGRGGLKRAVLGSVSDHVVRNAPCPVVVTGQAS
jgi:nucleotide-binding universal stress UspA family protein